MVVIPWAVCWLLLLPSYVHSFLFPLKDGAKCKDNADCVSLSFPRGCCLMTGLQHGRPVGRCQPIARLGDYCAPGDRRRRILGYSVYTFSCPCDTGLICRAAKFTQLPSRMGAFFDPQCVPEDFPGYATARPLVNNNLPPDYVTRQPDTVDLDLGVTVV